ncbi:MAG: redoxin domain-containing protein [Armatimonadetes bacterium]|nr:redoxin domain-containing protein [Armatimonadota bacterium]
MLQKKLSRTKVSLVGGGSATLPDARPALVLFVGHECPIANAYAPEVSRIAAEYAKKGVKTLLVYPDPALNGKTIQRHQQEFKLPSMAIHDKEHKLVNAFGATVTPQAFLLLPNGEIAYQGRIDDRYADYSKLRREPNRRDLRNALDAVLAGKKPQVRETVALGCVIPSRK